MCGIAGIVNFNGAPVEVQTIERMVQSLSHRGPDGAGIWVDGPVGLGHRRLAIRDLSKAGRQPMFNASGELVVTYNGEIYNDAQLRKEIRAATAVSFTSACDTEVIAPAYALWGAAAVRRLEGMFAFALWDSRKQQLVLARDPIGIKPLYYSWDGRSLRFGSEIKALLAVPEQRRVLSAEAIHRFLAQGYPGPTRTLLEDVVPLPPGCVLIAGPGHISVERYWKPLRTGDVHDLGTALDQFEALFPSVVADSLVSDVPVGLLLSGGIDSSLIASTLTSKEVCAFTAQFRSKSYDETSMARAVASRFGLQHRAIQVDADSEVERRFLCVVHHYDGNCADSSGFAFHAVCEAARRHVPVLLTGDGADEFFAGYETYRATRLAHMGGWLIPSRVARLAAQLLFRMDRSGERRMSHAEKLARFLAGVGYGAKSPHPQWRRYAFPNTLNQILGAALKDVVERIDPLDEYVAAVDAASGSLVDRALVADQVYYLPGDLLVKSDAMSMAHGVEVRVPFLDRRIMEFAGRMHQSLLTPLRGPDKKLLRRALAHMGAQDSLINARKRGFNVPVAYHLRNGLRSLGDRLLGRGAEVLSPYLSPHGVARLWREHMEGQANHGYVLWTLLTLAVWRESSAAR